MLPFPDEAWPVKPPIHGKRGREVDGEPNPSHDVSGIACIETKDFPRHGLVIDDERRSAQLVIVDDGRLFGGDSIKLLAGEGESLDGEGVAYDAGCFYVIGSHGHPRDPKHKLDPDDDEDLRKIRAQIDAASHLFEIAVPPDGFSDPDKTTMTVTRDLSLRPALASLAVLDDFFDKRLDRNGLSIEGLAVRGGVVHAGLRSPILTGAELGRPEEAESHFAGLVSVALKDLPAPEGRTCITWLPLGAGRGIRDLAPYGDGLLILAGPSRDIAADISVPAGAYALYFKRWPDGALKKLGLIPGGHDPHTGEALKPEAILPLDVADGRLRVLVLFDHAESGGPRPFLFNLP